MSSDARPAPLLCTRACPRKQNKFNYTQWKWMSQCSFHDKAEVPPLDDPDNLWSLFHLDANVDLPPDQLDLSRAMPLGSEELRALATAPSSAVLLSTLQVKANALAKDVSSATGWSFGGAPDKRSIRKDGAFFRYICSQSTENDRERGGQGHSKTTSRKDAPTPRFPCAGEFTVEFNLNQERVDVCLQHLCHHRAYENRRLSESDRAEIARCFATDFTIRPTIAHASLRATYTDPLTFSITEGQVRYKIGRLRRLEQNGGVNVPRSSNETPSEEATRLVDALDTLSREELLGDNEWEGWWEAMAFHVSAPEFEQLAAEGREAAIDGTHGKIAEGWELLACLVEHRGSAYPVGYLVIRASKSRTIKSGSDYANRARLRYRIMVSWLEALRTRNLTPRFFLCDKDFSEISAIAKVWPSLKILLCLWHMKKAVDRRLASAKNKSKTVYFPLDAQAIIPELDLDFLPSNHISTNTSRTNTAILTASAAALSSLAPLSSSAPTSAQASLGPFDLPPPFSTATGSEPPSLPRIKVVGAYATVPGATYASNSAPVYSAAVRAQMVGLERVESEATEEERIDMLGGEAWEDRVEGDEEEEGWKGAVEPMTSDERRVEKEKAAKKSAKAKETRNVLCPADDRPPIVAMMARHTSMHPQIPFPNQGRLSADAIYRLAAAEAYRHCYGKKLGDAWAYLWENWYRPARWVLWARSSYHEISTWRTTMGAERHWATIKKDLQGKRSPGGTMWVLGKVTVPNLQRKLRLLRSGDEKLNWREGVSRWRLVLQAEFERRWKRDEKLKKLAAQARGEAEEEEDDQPASTDEEEPISAGRAFDLLDSDHLDSEPAPQTIIPARKKRTKRHRPNTNLTTLSQHTLKELAVLDLAPLDPLRISTGNQARFHPTASDTATLDPAIDPSLAFLAVPPSPTEVIYLTDPVQGVCGCPSFLTSRFLTCKHLIRYYTRAERPPLWFFVVERFPTAPFWRIPPRAIELEERLRQEQEGVEDGEAVILKEGVRRRKRRKGGAGDKLAEVVEAAEGGRPRSDGTDGDDEGGGEGILGDLEDEEMAERRVPSNETSTPRETVPSSSFSYSTTDYGSDNEAVLDASLEHEQDAAGLQRIVAVLQGVADSALEQDPRAVAALRKKLGWVLSELEPSLRGMKGGANAASRGKGKGRSGEASLGNMAMLNARH